MTKEDIAEELCAELPIHFLEPHELMGKGLIGITEDHKHLIYGYYTLATYIAEDFRNNWEKEHEEGEETPDFMLEAFDYLDYNLMSYPLAPEGENGPIIIYELYERVPEEKATYC